MIYMDNGATSFPKPSIMVEAMTEAMINYCANPGRSGYKASIKSGKEVYRTRQTAAEIFNIARPEQIIFTKNCTEAINIALKGVLKPGDHVITTSMEHNSVIRPLKKLVQQGVDTTVVRCDGQGRLDPDDVKRAIRRNTRLIVMTAASNVTGTKMPLYEVGRIALGRGILFMVDGAQGAGHMEIDAENMNIDILAVPGHKGLLGPQGTGMLYVKEGLAIEPLLEGGTGSSSKMLDQPHVIPEGYEAGTLNTVGIIGLGASLEMIRKIGVKAIAHHERKLTEQIEDGLRNIEGIQVYGPEDTRDKTAVIAFNINGMDCEEVASLLDEEYDIATRAGFHCSGLAHETIGTDKAGCVRITPGFYTQQHEIKKVIKAVSEIAVNVENSRKLVNCQF